ncbi:MAG: hypothetical protein NTW95_09875 [Candidatus Aminicenantes bacterium]|nr:hypothetical protein [Candidatus Aminicenantes bacterium]
MEKEKQDAKNAFIAKFADYVIGFTLLSKGWEEAEHIHHFPLRVVFIFLAGAFIILGASFSHFFEKRIRNFSGLFHLLEGIVEILVATILLQRGRHWIPVFLAFIGLVYFSMGLAQLLAGEGKQKEAMMRLRIAFGIVFIVFGAGMATLNALTEFKLPVLICCAVLVVAGIIILSRRGVPSNERSQLASRLYDRLHRQG